MTMALRESKSKSLLNCGQLDRQRTVRFSVASSAPASSYGEGSSLLPRDEFQKGHSRSGESLDASQRCRIIRSTPLPPVGDSRMVSRFGGNLDRQFSEGPRSSEGSHERPEDMPQRSQRLSFEPKGASTQDTSSQSERRVASRQNEPSSNRRILEVEGTPSTFRRLAGTYLVPAPSGVQSIPKVANVAYFPRSSMRCGSCPLLKRCTSRSPTKRFALYSTIPGFGSGASHAPGHRKSTLSGPSACPLSFLSCAGKGSGVTLDSKDLNSTHGFKECDISQLVNELHSLKEQNATLLRDRSSLLVQNASQRDELLMLRARESERVSSVGGANEYGKPTGIPLMEEANEQSTRAGPGSCAANAGPQEEMATNAFLVSQLRSAHSEIAELKSTTRTHAVHAALAQDRIGLAMNALGRGGEVFACDPNDITVQEAALDSLLMQARRRVHAAREFVWSAVGIMKDLIDQTFERIERLLKSDVSQRQKVAYVKELHGLVTSQLDPALAVYGSLDKLRKEMEDLKATVFDPKRNNPYCPCRPRRMVLEGDLEHVQRQLKDSNEALRKVRAQVVRLEMENLNHYVQERCGADWREKGAGDVKDRNSTANDMHSIEAQESKGNFAEKEHMQLLLDAVSKEKDTVDLNEAIASLRGEVEMLKDRAMQENVMHKQPTAYRTDEIFRQGVDITRLLLQAGDAAHKLAETLCEDRPDAKVARDQLLNNSRLLRKAAEDVQSRKQPLGAAVQQAATVLGSVNLRGVKSDFSSEQIRLLEMVDRQAQELRKINRNVQMFAAAREVGAD